jgi:lysophospholipase L1-like esterase
LALSFAVAAQTARLPTPEELDAAQRRLRFDWAGLNVFGSENSELAPPAPGESRVVFFGDEITALWGRVPGKGSINRGIIGQTTAQMLVRFRQDVIDLKPKVVVIQGGSNDVAGAMGPATEGVIADNIVSMVELARVNGVRPVLAAVTPVCDCAGSKQTGRRPPFRIAGLNRWMKGYAAKNGLVFVDYYAALVGEERQIKREFTIDGFYLSEAGYAVMGSLVEKGIGEALAAR